LFTQSFKNASSPYDLLQLVIADPRISPPASGLRVKLESVHGVGFSSAIVRTSLSPIGSDEEVFAQSIIVDAGWEYVGRTVPRMDMLVETPLILTGAHGPDVKLAILPCTRCDHIGKDAEVGKRVKFQIKSIVVNEHKL
jgi:hypothetical protein